MATPHQGLRFLEINLIITSWPEFRLRYRLPDGKTRFDIVVSNPQGGRSVVAARLDGQAVTIAAGAANLPLHWDSREHRAEVVLGPALPITSMAG